MNRVRNYTAFAFLCLLLSACQTLNVPVPQTFSQKATAVYNGLDAAVQTTATLLQARKITPDDAQQAHDQIANLKNAVDVAVRIHANDPQAGEDKLAATITALSVLQDYLARRQQ